MDEPLKFLLLNQVYILGALAVLIPEELGGEMADQAKKTVHYLEQEEESDG